LFATIGAHNLKLNPEKCIFGVQEEMFFGFLLTKRGIEENPDKCAAIMEMRSPANIKEVQRLTEHTVALSRFLSASGNKVVPEFSMPKKE